MKNIRYKKESLRKKKKVKFEVKILEVLREKKIEIETKIKKDLTWRKKDL